MKVTTYEATIENGQIKLKDNVRLPEHGNAWVVVPDLLESNTIHMRNPHLADPKQVVGFTLEVIEESQDARL